MRRTVGAKGKWPCLSIIPNDRGIPHLEMREWFSVYQFPFTCTIIYILIDTYIKPKKYSSNFLSRLNFFASSPLRPFFCRGFPGAAGHGTSRRLPDACIYGMGSVLRVTYGVCLASVVGCSWLHALYLGTEGRGDCKAKRLGSCRLITILCISDRRCKENETWILGRLDNATVLCPCIGPNHPHSKAYMETDLRTFMSMVHYHIIRAAMSRDGVEMAKVG